MELITIFSDRLKELMFQHDEIKSEALGKAINVSGQAVRKWTNGESLPNLNQLLKIVEYFNCSIEL